VEVHFTNWKLRKQNFKPKS